jgi:hypothetical protein
MPGKSKRKKMRYTASKQNRMFQTQSPAASSASAAVAGPATAAKVQTPYPKSSPAGKTAAAQYTPELLKHVGTELKITLILSASILLIIIILAFIIH